MAHGEDAARLRKARKDLAVAERQVTSLRERNKEHEAALRTGELERLREVCASCGTHCYRTQSDGIHTTPQEAHTSLKRSSSPRVVRNAVSCSLFLSRREATWRSATARSLLAFSNLPASSPRASLVASASARAAESLQWADRASSLAMSTYRQERRGGDV